MTMLCCFRGVLDSPDSDEEMFEGSNTMNSDSGIYFEFVDEKENSSSKKVMDTGRTHTSLDAAVFNLEEELKKTETSETPIDNNDTKFNVTKSQAVKLEGKDKETSKMAGEGEMERIVSQQRNVQNSFTIYQPQHIISFNESFDLPPSRQVVQEESKVLDLIEIKRYEDKQILNRSQKSLQHTISGKLTKDNDFTASEGDGHKDSDKLTQGQLQRWKLSLKLDWIGEEEEDLVAEVFETSETQSLQKCESALSSKGELVESSEAPLLSGVMDIVDGMLLAFNTPRIEYQKISRSSKEGPQTRRQRHISFEKEVSPHRESCLPEDPDADLRAMTVILEENNSNMPKKTGKERKQALLLDLKLQIARLEQSSFKFIPKSELEKYDDAALIEAAILDDFQQEVRRLENELYDEQVGKICSIQTEQENGSDGESERFKILDSGFGSGTENDKANVELVTNNTQWSPKSNSQESAQTPAHFSRSQSSVARSTFFQGSNKNSNHISGSNQKSDISHINRYSSVPSRADSSLQREAKIAAMESRSSPKRPQSVLALRPGPVRPMSCLEETWPLGDRSNGRGSIVSLSSKSEEASPGASAKKSWWPLGRLRTRKNN